LPARQSGDRVKTRNPALLQLDELIPDADLEDDKFGRVKGFKIEHPRIGSSSSIVPVAGKGTG
jgi:hypothetical protein